MKGFRLSRILNNKDFIYALSLFVIIGFICISFFELSKQKVTIVQADEKTTIQTHANTVEAALNEMSVEVGEHDDLSHQMDTLVSSDMKIQHTTAKEIIVNIDGKENKFFTTSNTVEEFLQEENIELEEHDQLSVAWDADISDQLTFDIEKAFQIVINDAGDKKKVWTTGETIEELLDREKMELNQLDRVKPALSTHIEDDSTTVDITRVEKVTDVVKEEKDYAVVKRNDQSLQKGKEKVVESGEPGTIEKHYEVVMENGEEVSRELIKEEVTKESKDKVVALGTKVNKPKTKPKSAKSTKSTKSKSSPKKEKVVSRSKNESQGKTLYMKATAYNWNCNSCDGRGLTATGYNLKANPSGVVAVDPSVIPLGTKVWVEGYGYAIARDTGGNIKGNRIDVHVSSKQKASNYGRKNVQVKIIK